MRAGDGDGGDGGGFGAEDARAKGNGSPFVLGEESHLFGGPAAFGAYGEGVGDDARVRVYIPPFAMGLRRMGHPVVWHGVGVCKGAGEGGGLFGFGEEDAGGGFFLFEGGFQGDRVGDLGDVGAAGLFAGFECDASPAFGTLERGVG